MSALGEWDDDPTSTDSLDDQVNRVEEISDEAGDEPPPLYYGSVDQFVREMIIPVFRRKVGARATHRWSAEWWRNPEAVIRLEALWRSWEHLRLDPATGMSVWLRDHADHHLGVLMNPDGPFAWSEDSNQRGEALPHTDPPAGLFPNMHALED